MPRRRPAPLGAVAVRHTGIVVTDLSRALRFYRDLLGFAPWREAVESGPFIDAVVGLKGAKLHWAKLKAPDGAVVELLQYLSHPQKAPNKVRPQDIGASHIALTVPDVDALCKALRRKGYKVNSAPAVSPDGKAKVAYAHDGDGTIVEVVQEL